jgi:hypothetical protein
MNEKFRGMGIGGNNIQNRPILSGQPSDVFLQETISASASLVTVRT